MRFLQHPDQLHLMTLEKMRAVRTITKIGTDGSLGTACGVQRAVFRRRVQFSDAPLGTLGLKDTSTNARPSHQNADRRMPPAERLHLPKIK